MKIKMLGLIGLLALSSCATLAGKRTFQEEYGNLLVLKRYTKHIELYYDRDNDNQADLLMIYNINSINPDGTFYLELSEIGDDKNKDGTFTDDEINSYEAVERIKVKVKDLI